MKTCPYCAEEIQDAATVCKHCGRDLATGQTAPVAIVPAPPSSAYKTWNAVAGLALGVLILSGCSVVLIGEGLSWALASLIVLIVALIGRASAR